MMKEDKKIIIQLVIKLLLGATIFFILGKLIHPEKSMFNRGIISAYIGLTIFFTGEAINKIYKQKKTQK